MKIARLGALGLAVDHVALYQGDSLVGCCAPKFPDGGAGAGSDTGEPGAAGAP